MVPSLDDVQVEYHMFGTGQKTLFHEIYVSTKRS